MKKSRWLLLSRLSIVTVLYPWLVSFGPDDSLSHQISIYGSEGSYTYVTRDCSNNITSRLPVPFSEIAASYEGSIQNDIGYKVRAGYLHGAYGYNLAINSNDTLPLGVGYGGALPEFNRPFWGFELGGLAFNRRIALADNPSKLSYSFGARLGYLTAWYLTADFLNSDTLI